MPEIMAITPGSPAARKRIARGDVLLRINGHPIADVLDYRFYAAEKKLSLELQKPGGKVYHVTLRKEEYEDLGLEFGEGLMDKQWHCKNKCVFCFIDQLPPGLRKPLYFKDDDARLGFLFGNYITLTNLRDEDAQRIIAMRLSPVNISVHTMDPALRSRMMGNPHAGESLRFIEQFSQAGLELNLQLVLCPGWNDGEALRHSLRALVKLPTARSIAAVPVGLTKFRETLPQLRPFTKEEAQSVIDLFAEFRSQTSAELCASDEFFLLAGHEPPGGGYYGAYPQLENGVGLWTCFKEDVLDALQFVQPITQYEPRKLTLATGAAAYPLMGFLVDEIKKIWHTIDINVRCIENRFFGEQITVAGLLTGEDIIAQLRGGDLGEVLLPAACFNHDGITLDGMTREDISHALGVPVRAVKNEAEEFLQAIIGG